MRSAFALTPALAGSMFALVLLSSCAAPPPSAATGPSATPAATTAATASTPSPECRDVDATVLLDGTTQHLPVRACRDDKGAWQLMRDDEEDAGYSAGTFIVYDPWLWGYPFGFSSSLVIVDHLGHFHGNHFHGNFHGAFHGYGGMHVR